MLAGAATTVSIDAFIVENFKETLHALKGCCSEEQRREYITLLRAVAPVLAKQGDHTGMMTKVAARLRVPYGTRAGKKKQGKTWAYAFTKQVPAREAFLAAVEQAAKPRKELQVGDTVLCRGQLAVLTAFDAQTDACSVTYSAEGTEIEKTVNYLSRFGNGAKSARIQRPPALLAPPRRKERKDKLSEETKEHVKIVYETNCPTSPHTRDRVRRLRISRCWEHKQAIDIQPKQLTHAAKASLTVSLF